MVEPPLPGGGALPPYTGLVDHPSPQLAVALLISAVAIGAAGLSGLVYALTRGWRPRVSRLVAGGVLALAALAVVPPVGSADPQSYAAYGRIADLGHNPYTLTPAQAYARYADPVAASVEDPWRHTASVYGPVATLEQRLAAHLGGDSVRATVSAITWFNVLAFALTGALLLAMARDPAQRRWVGVLWWCNPLVLFELVAGAHLDTFVALAAVGVAALLARPHRWSAAAAGVVLGLGVDVKLSAIVLLAGFGWAVRRDRARAAQFVAGTLATVALAYAMAPAHALDQVRTAARYASRATPWRSVASLLDHTIGHPTSRTVLGVLAAAALVALWWLLLRRQPPAADHDAAALAGPAFVAAFAALLAAPYVLPWYAGPAWALLALASTRLASPRHPPYLPLLVALTAALAAAYVTRDVPLPGDVHLIVTATRSVIGPIVGLTVAVVTVRGAIRPATEPDRAVPCRTGCEDDEPAAEPARPRAAGRLAARRPAADRAGHDGVRLS